MSEKGPRAIDPPRRPRRDPDEIARFLRPQPPIPVPQRVRLPPLPGLVAYAVLGGLVVRPGE